MNPPDPNAESSSAEREISKRRKLSLVLAGAGVFLILIAGVSIWLIRSLLFTPAQSVVLPSEVASEELGRPVQAAPRNTAVLAGLVQDGQGKPIVGAAVTFRTQWNSGTDASPHGQTDSSGHFSLARLRAGSTQTLTVTMPGYAPYLAKVAISDKPSPLTVVLTSGRTLSGQVLDKLGNPLAGANIAVNQWRGNKSVDLHAATDAAGQFEIHDAPMDQIGLIATKEGFNTNTFTYAPDKPTGIFHLSFRPTISGTVTDAQTHQRISQFKIIAGARRQATAAPTFYAADGKQFNKGQYQLTLAGMGGIVDGWFVRIEAHGCYSVDTGPFTQDGIQDFQLESGGQDLDGKIIGTDGKPGAKTDLVLVLADQFVALANGSPQNSQIRDATDAKGHFSVPPQKGDWLLAMVNANGYAQIDQSWLADEKDVHLAGWAKLAGSMQINGKGAANQTVAAWLAPAAGGDSRLPHVVFTARTDGAGEFHFDRVPPGELVVGRVMQQKKGSAAPVASFSMEQNVTIVPGGSAEVKLQ